MTLLLSQAGDSDWPGIWPVWRAVVSRADTYAFDPNASSDDARRIWFQPPPAEVWIATEPTEAAAESAPVLGTYLLKPNQAGNGSHIANAGFMVSPTARGLGVGRTMGEHCLERARQLGYLGMQFNAVVASNHNAIALWYSLGFETIGSVPRAFRHPVDGLVDLHIMYRDL